MNKLERYIHNTVSNFPRLKRMVTESYQRCCCVIPIKKVDSRYPISVREGFFFGFHDKCPWSADNKMLLAHCIGDIPLRLPKSDDQIGIGYFTGEDYSNFNLIGGSLSWNWQQGAMLQWLGLSSTIIYNDYDGQQNCSKIVTSHGECIKTFSKPVAAVSRDGKKALSYSFERLRRAAPGYGYASGFEQEEQLSIPKKDGLYLIDIVLDQFSKLFSINDIVQSRPDHSMKDAYHYFSHCLFSPSGKKFAFFHRWLKPNGILLTRLISCDLETIELFIFPTSGSVSHYCWVDDEYLLAYANTDKLGNQYYLFRDKTSEFKVIGYNQLTSDGHPQFSLDKGLILTDTYPDRFRRQTLIIYDIKRNQRYDLLKLRIPFNYRYDLRCDFHPRWNRDTSIICFDSAHTNIRALCTVRFRLN